VHGAGRRGNLLEREIGNWPGMEGDAMGRKTDWVYIMTNPTHTALYTGVTSNLPRRVWQHRMVSAGGFTAKYHACLLVYFKEVDDAMSAITREKQLKAGSRQRKLALINSRNPAWRDLYEDIR